MTRLLCFALAGLLYFCVAPSSRAQNADPDSFPGSGIVRFLKEKLTPSPPPAPARDPVIYDDSRADRGPVAASEVVATHQTRGGVSVICTNCD
jgi:hypothetical protein